MSSRAVWALVFFVILIVAAFAGVWYWMHTPQFEMLLRHKLPPVTTEEKIQTLQDLRKSNEGAAPVEDAKKAAALEQLRASNTERQGAAAEVGASSDASTGSSDDEKRKSLQSLHDSQ